MTPAEKLLWSKIRSSQLGYKFRRQQGVGLYVVDFYCPQLKIAVEVDGSVHGEAQNIKRDQIRSTFLAEQGLTVIRYRNEQVLYEIDSVVIHLKNICDRLRSSPPFQGGDREGVEHSTTITGDRINHP